MSVLAEQVRLVHYALMFYTRLPLPSLAQVDQSVQDHSSRYFPLIGWLVGGLCALVFLLFALWFPNPIAILLSMLFGILLTGAFHEDGLADSCDGLGGGWDQKTILTIMKDSRVGTYGLIGLSSALALKFTALSQLHTAQIPLVLVAGHVLSRWASTVFMWQLDYVRQDAASKAKPITQAFNGDDFSIATVATFALFIWAPFSYLLALLWVLPVLIYFYQLLQKWLGGYTGDTLGAVQQITEVGFYLGMTSVLVL